MDHNKLQTIPVTKYKVLLFHDSVTDTLCHRILSPEQNTIAFVYGKPTGELCLFPLDERSSPIKVTDLGYISSISTAYIKPGLYNIFVITIDGTLTVFSLKYKLTQSILDPNPYYHYEYIKEQTNTIPSECTYSISLSYKNESNIILILSTSNGDLYAYKYHFHCTFDKPLMKLSFSYPISCIYPFYTSTVMSTQLLVSFTSGSPIITTLNGRLEQLPSFSNEFHHHDPNYDIIEWIYPVYGKAPTIFHFCSCGLYAVNGNEKHLPSNIDTIWTGILQRGDLESNNKQLIYDCFIIRDTNGNILFMDQKGEAFLLDITSNIQCAKMIKLSINNHDEQILAIFTSTQVVLFRNLIKNYLELTTSENERQHKQRIKFTKEQLDLFFKTHDSTQIN